MALNMETDHNTSTPRAATTGSPSASYASLADPKSIAIVCSGPEAEILRRIAEDCTATLMQSGHREADLPLLEDLRDTLPQKAERAIMQAVLRASVRRDICTQGLRGSGGRP